jgi:hypothetical protein
MTNTTLLTAIIALGLGGRLSFGERGGTVETGAKSGAAGSTVK